MIDTCASCSEIYDDNDGYDGLCLCPFDGLCADELDAFATTGSSPPGAMTGVRMVVARKIVARHPSLPMDRAAWYVSILPDREVEELDRLLP